MRMKENRQILLTNERTASTDLGQTNNIGCGESAITEMNAGDSAQSDVVEKPHGTGE